MEEYQGQGNEFHTFLGQSICGFDGTTFMVIPEIYFGFYLYMVYLIRNINDRSFVCTLYLK